MIVFKKAESLSLYLSQKKKSGRQIHFVPTMGALHAGHLSLISAAKADNAVTVCSIFVNPTQFNNADDFKHYPITIEKDIEQLLAAECDVLFLPVQDEIYPHNYAKKFYQLGPLQTVLEGHYRPGHFQGVCQVVDRLLQLVTPDHLYLGAKDYQQCLVITKLLSIIGKDKEIMLHIQPTLREEDGLAMSSRNLRLNEEQRKKAAALYQTLLFVKANIQTTAITDLENAAKAQLTAEGFKVDYISIADAQTLQPTTPQTPNKIVLAAAAIGNIRLIDNVLLN